MTKLYSRCVVALAVVFLLAGCTRSSYVYRPKEFQSTSPMSLTFTVGDARHETSVNTIGSDTVITCGEHAVVLKNLTGFWGTLKRDVADVTCGDVHVVLTDHKVCIGGTNYDLPPAGKRLVYDGGRVAVE